MTLELGDVKINGKPYRIDVQSYRGKDVVDFSPRASTPGGGVIHSDLMLYQPMLQTSWQHGFGFSWYSDALGYLKTEGNIDTRQEGIVTLFTKATSSDTYDSNKLGGVLHKNKFYTWGNKGVRRFDGEAWEEVPYLSPTGIVNTMFSNGEYLFAVPYNGRIRKSANAGLLTVRPNETDSNDAYIDEANATTNYGTTSSLHVGTDAAIKHRKILLKPAVTSLPVGHTLTSAKLRLHCKSTTGTAPALKAHRALLTWTEAGVTWNKYDGSSDWTTAGAAASGTDYAAATLYSGTPTKDRNNFIVMALDLTEFASLIASNKGILIWEEGIAASNSWEFSSASDPNEALRPTLELEYTLATEWSDAGVDANATDFGWITLHAGKIYAGKRATNIVHYSTTADLSDLHGDTAGDTNEIVVGVGAVPIKRAIEYISALYLARSDGLWQLGDDNIARRMLDFSSSISDNNFRSMAVHNGYLVFPIQDTLYQWNGSRLSNITPQRITDTFPYTTYGRFDNLLASDDFLYCTARTNEATYTESLLCFDGVGWHKVCDLITDGVGTITALVYDAVNKCLWYHLDGATQITYSIPLQENSSYPYADFPITGTHSIITSRWDMGFRRVLKSMPSLLVEGDNLTDTRYLTVYYSIDGGDWVEWKQITEDGITEVTFPGGKHTQEFYYIQLKVTLTSGTSAQSPILEGLTLRFLMRPELALGWSFNIPTADNLVYAGREDYRTAQDLWEDLLAARDSKAPVVFEDLDGKSYYIYLTSITSQAVERHVDEENGGHRQVEKVTALNLIEAK